MLYKEKRLEKQSEIDSCKDLECKQEEILGISSIDYHEREELQLPTESQYIDGSFEIEQDMLLIEELNKDIL